MIQIVNLIKTKREFHLNFYFLTPIFSLFWFVAEHVQTFACVLILCVCVFVFTSASDSVWTFWICCIMKVLLVF